MEQVRGGGLGGEARGARGPEGATLADLLALDDAAFRALFSGSPVKRIGRDRFIRNVLTAAGNSGDPSLVAACRNLLFDASPLVRGAAVWALSRLTDGATFGQIADAASRSEADPTVRAEWASANAEQEFSA